MNDEITLDPYWGCKGVDDQETDYRLGGELEVPKPRFTYWDNEITYHQPDVSKVSCTVSSATGTASDLVGKELTLDQQKELWAEALNKGANPETGWYIRKAVDVVRNLGSKMIGEELLSFYVVLGGEDFWDVLDKGYTVNCGFRGNKTYQKDRDLDAILDGTYFGDATYGHAIRVVKDKEGETYSVIVDNYKKSNRPNVYRFPKENLAALLKNKVFFPSGYIFVIKKDFDEMNTLANLPLWGKASVEKAIKKGWTEWHNPDVIVGDAKLEVILVQLGGLTKKLGDVSAIRLAVAFDRLGLLN